MRMEPYRFARTGSSGSNQLLEIDMKLAATLATIALACCLTGCATNKTTSAAPGAVNGDKACCAEGANKGAACCKEGEKAAPGAVSGKSECSATCKDAKTAAPGAVSGSGCCKEAKTAAPGAVSGKSGCCSGK
jgi:hypothetical protein